MPLESLETDQGHCGQLYVKDFRLRCVTIQNVVRVMLLTVWRRQTYVKRFVMWSL